MPLRDIEVFEAISAVYLIPIPVVPLSRVKVHGAGLRRAIPYRGTGPANHSQKRPYDSGDGLQSVDPIGERHLPCRLLQILSEKRVPVLARILAEESLLIEPGGNTHESYPILRWVGHADS